MTITAWGFFLVSAGIFGLGFGLCGILIFVMLVKAWLNDEL